MFSVSMFCEFLVVPAVRLLCGEVRKFAAREGLDGKLIAVAAMIDSCIIS